MKNLFVFPLSEEIVSILRHGGFNQYRFIFYEEFTTNEFVVNSPQFIKLKSWEDLTDQCCDALIIREDNVPLFKYNQIIDCLIKININVYVVASLAKEMNLSPSLKDKVHIIAETVSDLNITVKQLVPIDVPVIAILGDGKFTEKIRIQVILQNCFNTLDISVLSITAKEYASFLNMEMIPNLIFEPMLLSDKIVALNQFFYNLIFDKKPDLVLLSVPGASLPISEQYVEDFGEFAYTLCNALPPDILVRTLYFNNYDINFFTNDIIKMKYRYNIAPEYYHISSTSLVYPPSLMDNLGYLKVNSNTRKQLIKKLCALNLPCTFFEDDNDDNLMSIAKKMIASLSESFAVI